MGIDCFGDDRGHKKIWPEEKITIVAVKFLSPGIFKEDGSHQRYSRPRAFFCNRIDIRQQLVTKPNVFASNLFLFWAVHPRLVIRRAFRGVISVDGIESTEFIPAGQQIRRGGTPKASDIVSHERIA